MRFKISPFLISLASILAFAPQTRLAKGAAIANDVTTSHTNSPGERFTKRDDSPEIQQIQHWFFELSNNMTEPNFDQFTQDFVSNMHTANPRFNYLICHVDHDYNFEGTQGTDWTHYHITFFPDSYAIGYQYDALAFRAGNFTRHGDGGYQNWAYYGNVLSAYDSNDGRVVIFGVWPGT